MKRRVIICKTKDGRPYVFTDTKRARSLMQHFAELFESVQVYETTDNLVFKPVK